MTIRELKSEINNYNLGTTHRGWIMSNDALSYSNRYLSVVRIDASNHWIGHEKMSKMWSIICFCAESISFSICEYVVMFFNLNEFGAVTVSSVLF